MLWNWNYIESSRMFYCNNDYINQNDTAIEEAWILVNLKTFDITGKLSKLSINQTKQPLVLN